jgi:hypothetical protein
LFFYRRLLDVAGDVSRRIEINGEEMRMNAGSCACQRSRAGQVMRATPGVNGA